MDVSEILGRCDHTLLAVDCTWEQIKAICDDGMKYHTASVCIPPSFVKRAKEYDYIVVNDDLSEAVDNTVSIIKSAKLNLGSSFSFAHHC